MNDDDRTWHRGLVARWWAEVEQGGEDVARFRELAAAADGPVLDAGCGTGRVLLPLLDAGLDAEGSDASADMLAWCARLAEQRGHAPRLHRQAMHELDTGRHYAAVLMVGAFGIGSSRAEDLEGLRRIHAHLAPGGRLVFDLHLPTADAKAWQLWLAPRPLPTAWRTDGEQRDAGGDGTLQLWGRLEAFDPLHQRWTRGIRVQHRRGDKVMAEEAYSLSGTAYLLNEVQLMLEVAGFTDVQVFGGMEDRPAEPWRDQRLLVVAG